MSRPYARVEFIGGPADGEHYILRSVGRYHIFDGLPPWPRTWEGPMDALFVPWKHRYAIHSRGCGEYVGLYVGVE